MSTQPAQGPHTDLPYRQPPPGASQNGTSQNGPPQPPEAAPLPGDDMLADLDGLISRSQLLLSELEDFKRLAQRQQPQIPGLGTLISRVRADMAVYQRQLDSLSSRRAALPGQADGLKGTNSAGNSAANSVGISVANSAGNSGKEAGGNIGGDSEAADSASALDEGTREFLGKLRGSIDSSNLPYCEAMWAVAKRCQGLVSLSQTFSRREESLTARKQPRRAAKDGVVVDAVVNGGAEWVRVLRITPKRLLNEMAAAGWDWGGDDSEQEEEGVETDDEDDDTNGSVEQTVKHLVQAARAHMHKYRHPSLRIVFIRISEGDEPDIDRFMRKLRVMGAAVGKDPDASRISVAVDCVNSAFLSESISSPLAKEPFSKLFTHPELTATVNLDCSTIVALISDISHAVVEDNESLRLDIRKQIQAERDSRQEAHTDNGDKSTNVSGRGSLSRVLYPLLDGKELVCTRSVAEWVEFIISTFATDAEVGRAKIFLPNIRTPKSTSANESEDESPHTALQRLSIHPVPPNLRLPLRVVDTQMGTEWKSLVKQGKLPPSAAAVVPDPLAEEVNVEAFLYGWAEGITTVTANNTLGKALERKILEDILARKQKDEHGPAVHVHAVRRALFARPKNNPVNRKDTANKTEDQAYDRT